MQSLPGVHDSARDPSHHCNEGCGARAVPCGGRRVRQYLARFWFWKGAGPEQLPCEMYTAEGVGCLGLGLIPLNSTVHLPCNGQ